MSNCDALSIFLVNFFPSFLRNCINLLLITLICFAQLTKVYAVMVTHAEETAIVQPLMGLTFYVPVTMDILERIVKSSSHHVKVSLA